MWEPHPALSGDGSAVVSSARSAWSWLLVGFAAIYTLFQVSAAALGSDRGQAGLIVGALVIAATLTVERVAFGRTLTSAVRAIGLGRPHPTGLALSAVICVLLLLVVPVFAWMTSGSAAIAPGSLWLLPGLFAQAGIGEEVLFRGYLFGHLRRGRSFRAAAMLSMLPFVGVHLLLFFTMPWPVALAALLLSVALSFPMAHLYVLGGATIWAPALLHFVVQGTVKIVVLTGDASPLFPLVWMVASAILPMLAFLVRRL